MYSQKLLLICLFALFSLGIRGTELEPCAVETVNTAFFNMCPYAQNDPTDLTYTLGGYNYSLNFTLGTGHTPSCENPSNTVWGTLRDYNAPNQPCYDIAIDSPVLSFIDSDNSDSGLVSTFPINNGSNGYYIGLVVQLTCNSSMSSTDPTIFSISGVTSNTINVVGTSSNGCPYATLNKIINFMDQYKIPFIIVGVILGLFLMFLGLKLFNYAIFIVTLVAGTLFSGMLFFEFTKFGSQQWVLWIIFAACLLIGCVLGYLAVRYERLGFFVLGAALGVIGGLILYNAVLSHFMQGYSALFYVVLVVLGLIGGGLGIWLYKDIIIIATSLIGSYLAVRSVSVVIGGFPSELAIAQGVTNLSWFAYLYLAIIIVLAILGMYFQYREKRRMEEEEDPETLSAFYRKA